MPNRWSCRTIDPVTVGHSGQLTIPSWQHRAACKGAPRELFIAPDDDEEPMRRPSPLASAYCSRCPVRVDCLEDAIVNDMTGVWGNTTEHQRSLLGKVRTRVFCPDCRSRFIVREGDDEICLACALSWRAATGRVTTGASRAI